MARGSDTTKLLITSLNYSIIFLSHLKLDTYDHRVWKTGLPVRSAVLKPHAGELVVGWVTTSESSLLYVFVFVHIVNIDNNGRPALSCLFRCIVSWTVSSGSLVKPMEIS